jgi:hypothetical protein
MVHSAWYIDPGPYLAHSRCFATDDPLLKGK